MLSPTVISAGCHLDDQLGTTMIEAADDLYQKIQAYNTAVEGDKLQRAFDFGRQAHDGQVRASGEPYFFHPIAVANILADMRLDLDTVITALLHDTVEDCDVTLDTLQSQFGASVAQLVDGVTKLSRIGMQPHQNNMQAENFRKLLLAMSCLLYTSPSPRDKRQSRMPSSA